MSPEVKIFLNEHMQYIEDNNFYEVYLQIINKGLTQHRTEISETFLRAGINPLLYMDWVPMGFLCGSVLDLQEDIIPSNVKQIKAKAFSSTEVVTLRIPQGVEDIFTRAFSSCHYLREVYLPKSIKYLENSIFSNCTSLRTIYYDGTYDEWNKVDIYDYWISASKNHEVDLVCKDKRVRIQ